VLHFERFFHKLIWSPCLRLLGYHRTIKLRQKIEPDQQNFKDFQNFKKL
jgi:hypothetical protein